MIRAGNRLRELLGAIGLIAQVMLATVVQAGSVVVAEATVHVGSDAVARGVSHRWTFDEGYAASALAGLDRNRDGTYSREELSKLAEINIRDMRPFRYFLEVEHGGRAVELGEPTGVWMEKPRGGRLQLGFTTSFASHVSLDSGALRIRVHDSSGRLGFTAGPQGLVTLADTAPSRCKVRNDVSTIVDCGSTARSAGRPKRLALVIGNNDYVNLSKEKQLKKAVNDSRAVAETLGSLGYTVTRAENVFRDRFDRLWQSFLNDIEPGDIVALYFSGHGVELDGANHLLPSDAPPRESGEFVLRRAASNLNQLMAEVRRRTPGVALFVVDACRNNPFADPGTKSLGGRDLGLAPVEPPEGTFVMYSAGIGETSLDRLSEHDLEPTSVYTRKLLPLLATPGLTLPEVGQQVRVAVRDLARTRQPYPHRQTPAYYDQLIGDFCPAGCDAKEPAPKPICNGARTTVAGVETCLAVGESFRDCPACPEMVVIPAGTFMMGSDKTTDPDHDATEAPRHEVRIAKAFSVGKFEVTHDEWNACLKDGGCQPLVSDRTTPTGNRPETHVTWNDAMNYVDWLSRKTGKAYRLLTEAEWEYAARAGTAGRFAFPLASYDLVRDGKSPEYAQLCAHANGADRTATAARARNETCDDGFGDRTAPVGAFKPNAFGLHDMIGNVWEWVEDCWHDSHAGAPADGAARTEAACGKRVLRGGSWLTGPIGLRSAMRAGLRPDYRDDDAGLRIVRTVP